MALPRTLMRLIDPAEVYFEQRTPRAARRRSAHYPEAAVLRPEGEVGGRPASEAELGVKRRRGAQRFEDHRAALADAKQRWAAELRTAADELVRERATRMPLGTRTVDARIITFWRGDRVLEVTAGGSGGGHSSLSRLRRDLPITADALIDYLARAAINA